MPPAPKGAAHGPVQFKNLKKGTIIRLLQLLKPYRLHMIVVAVCIFFRPECFSSCLHLLVYIDVDSISRKKRCELKLKGRSKLSCGCGWTLNYCVGDFHPLFLSVWVFSKLSCG